MITSETFNLFRINSQNACGRRRSRATIFILVTALLLSPIRSYAEELKAEPVEPRRHYHPFFEVIGLGIFCTAAGLSTCLLFDKGEKKYSRPVSERGLEIDYLPSYIVSPHDGTGYQRLALKGYISNLIAMVEHRRGFANFDDFYSTSVRLGYSYDHEIVMPGFGIGTRFLRGGKNTRAFELWIPVFVWRKKAEENGRALVGFETVWVFGDNQIRPEFKVELNHKIAEGFYLTGTLAYFSDYPNSDAELAIGPSIIF